MASRSQSLTALSTAALPHLVDALEVLRQNLTWENVTFSNAQSALLLYLALTRALRAYRHVRARGPVSVVQDAYAWAAERVLALIVASPWVAPKVEAEMAVAKADV